MYGYIKAFCAEDFKSPDTKYFPAYSWIWNAPITKEKIRMQLEDMYENNIRVVYILPLPKEFSPGPMPTSLFPDYLTEEYFCMYRYAVEYAKDLGMLLWLYDEGGWPSGSANGMVTKNKPELARKHIVRGTLKEEESYPDLMNPDSTAEFISITHEKYREFLGDDLSDFMPVAFTDEPSVFTHPWSEALEIEFKNKFGYDIDIPSLFSISEKSAKMRIDYHDLCSRLFAENYFLKIKKWCNENRLLSSGHLGGEDETLGCIKYGYHHIMRLLRSMDIPGVDVIWRQIFPGQENLFFPRLASSAASQIGGCLSLSESFAIYGSGLTYEQMRFITLFQMVRGITLINIMNVTYKYDGYYMAGARPSFFSEAPGSRDKAVYNLYTARLSYLMALGKPATDCALYMPICDFWVGGEHAERTAKLYEKAGLEIEKAQGQFDIVDDDVILASDEELLRSGVIAMGSARYKVVFLPPSKYMPEAVFQKLEIFKLGGGRVMESISVIPIAEVGDGGENIRIHKRITEDGDHLYLVFNEAMTAVSTEITFEALDNIYILDPLNGDIRMPLHRRKSSKISVSINMCGGEGRVFFLTNKTFDAAKEQPHGRVIATLNDFGFKRLRSFVIGEECYESVFIDEEFSPALLGDWRGIVGEDFSGEGMYVTTFSKPVERGNIIISLGKVCQSCETFINGKSLGVRCMAPYEYEVGMDLLNTENELLIRVSNTPANQFVHTKSFDKWSENQFGRYHKIALKFERQSMEGGLYGPICILQNV